MTPEKLRAAMKQLGFADVFEVAIGADICATQEALDFVEEVPGNLPFMATSCCPAWSMMAKKAFPGLCPLYLYGVDTDDIDSPFNQAAA